MELQRFISVSPRAVVEQNMNIGLQNKKMGLRLEFQGYSSGTSLDSALWRELPEDLVLNLLAHLPLQCLARFHTVCKKWSTMLGSPYFVNLWNMSCWSQPWLIMCTPKSEIPCLAYSFANNTWQTLSLSFIPETKYGINYSGSAGGLLLVEVPNFSVSLDSVLLYVCNPLTKSCTEIPTNTSITAIIAKGMTESENGGYTVLAMGKTRENLCVVEVYESSTKSWRIGGSLPDGFCLRNQDMVFFNGYLFCVTVKPSGVMVYDIQHGSWNIVAMPVHEDVVNVVRSRLVACGSKVSMVEGIEKDHTVKDIIISEFQIDGNLNSSSISSSSSSTTTTSEELSTAAATIPWKEAARMPQEILTQFFKTSCSIWFECVGVGEFICFRAHGSVEVVVYNIRMCTWAWLAKCDDNYEGHKHMFMRSLAFQP